MAQQIQIRNGTAAEWTSANPILAVGELALEGDTRKFKIGDGITAWNSLLYATQGEVGPQGIQGDQGLTGPTGLTGATGKGIASIIRTSGTGAAGTIDTYTITFSDSTTTTFNIYNGADGAGATIVIDNLTSTSATSALSANQGKVLSDLVSTVSGDLSTHKAESAFKGALVTKTALQSIPSATPTLVTFGTVNYDTNIFFASNRFTIPSGVKKVKLFASMTFAFNSTGGRNLIIRKNGNTLYDGTGLTFNEAVSTGTFVTRLQAFSAPLTVSAGDYFEVFAFQVSGSSIDVGGDLGCWFALEVIDYEG